MVVLDRKLRYILLTTDKNINTEQLKCSQKKKKPPLQCRKRMQCRNQKCITAVTSSVTNAYQSFRREYPQ